MEGHKVNIQNNTQITKPYSTEIMRISPDGTIWVSPDANPTETAKKVLDQMREQWLNDMQSAKIREQDNLIRKLHDYIDSLEGCGDSLFRGLTRDEALNRWENIKKEKP